jgi:mucin-19
MKTVWQRFSDRRVSRRRQARHGRRDGAAMRMRTERLEPRALLAVTVPPSITSTVVEIDDNVLVDTDGGTIEATSSYVQIFGNSRGRIDRATGATNADLLLKAQSAITVTGAIGATAAFDTLTLESLSGQPVNLQQSVTLQEDLLVVKAGSFSIGSTVDIGGDLTITDATTVLFAGNVTVDGDLTITNATSITFTGTLTVGGTLTITNATGTTRFAGDVVVGGASITSTALVQVQAGFTADAGGSGADADVTFTTDQITFTTASLQTATGTESATLTIRPRTVSRNLTIASPPGIPSGLNITDADIFAIQPGWKRVVFGDEAAGTGAVRIGSIGSQYGGFSQILNTTTIVGGTIDVVQSVDVTSMAGYLELVARGTGSGDGRLTVSAPINQTEGERSEWLRLTSAGSIEINAPVWATQMVSLTTTAGGTITQGGPAAAITVPGLAVNSDGAVTLADFGNAVSLVAIKTTNDSVVLREDSGYSISQITTIDEARDTKQTVTVTGIDSGTGTVRLVTISGETASTVGQGRAILAAGLGLEGAGSDWNLSLATNDIATLAADTGSVVFRDLDDLTIGTVAAVTPRSAISGITVERTLAVTAGTTLTITAAGDIISGDTSGTAVTLSAPSGISTAGDVVTEGADVAFNHATTLTGDVVFDLEDGPTRGEVEFASTVQGTTSGQESLTIGGDLDARGSIGSTTALESLSVSGESTLTGGITLRTTGNQTYSGAATSTGTITIQAGSGSSVDFLDAVTLAGLITATADTAAYDVQLTGSPVSVTNAVTFANTGTVTLGDQATDGLLFIGGLTSTAPALTELAGTIATTNANASFGTTKLTADTTVSTGTGNATFAGTVNGGYDLTVDATGDTTFSAAVGGTTPLVELDTDAGGRTLLNGGSVATSGNVGQIYRDAVVLAVADVTLAATGQGLIMFASTVDGGRSLTVNTQGNTVFDGAVGGTTPLASLTTDAGGRTRITASTVKTSGNQVYNDPVTFEEPPAPTSVSISSIPETLMAGATVGLLAGLDAAGNSLRIEGNAVFGNQPGSPMIDVITDAIDPVEGLGGLVVTGGSLINSNLITSISLNLPSSFTTPSNPIVFQGGVTLGSDVTILGSSVWFQSTVTGSGKAFRVFAVPFGGTSSSVVFDGDVGTAQAPVGPLQALCVAGAVMINAAIYSTGPVQIAGMSIDGDADNAIRTPTGTVSLEAANSIGATTPIAVQATSVNAETATGAIRLRGIGDLVVGDDGLISGDSISLDASGEIRVPGGKTIDALHGVTTTKPIRWGLLGTADSGPGSLRDVIGKANATRAAGVIEFAGGQSTFVLQSPLPGISTPLTINGGTGGNSVVFDGNRSVNSGLVFTAQAAGSSLSNVVLRNFTGFGVQLGGAQNVLVDTITVQSLNTATSMGLYATGNLAGTKVVGSTFSGGLRGARLESTRNLVFGELGRGNVLSNNRAAPRQPRFAGTGIRAEGDCTGTVVEGNTFTNNNYGFAFIGARNLVLRNNTFTKNSIAGIYIEGNSAGSSQSANTFGTGSDRNKTNVLRAKKSIFATR